MQQKELPPRYYLGHAYELFNYLENCSSHLLDQKAQSYLRGFFSLDEDSQCLLVRVLTRKPQFFRKAALEYSEINDPQNCIAQLVDNGYLSEIKHQQVVDSFYATLTKPELVKLGLIWNLPSLSKLSKVDLTQTILERRRDLLNRNVEVDQDAISNAYIQRAQQTTIDYLLFLFFGDLNNRFQRFVMRDLGVMPTKRRQQEAQAARFQSLQEARFEFDCRFYLRQLHTEEHDPPELMEFLQAAQTLSTRSLEKLRLRYADTLVAREPEQAIAVWSMSSDSQALEKRIRFLYTHGDRKLVKTELENLQSKQLNAKSQLFVTDFYARKFLGKRTSTFTDMLRNASPPVALDEAYVNDAEQGVINGYIQSGVDAWFTENKIWRVLFALAYWDLLFTHR